MEEKRFTEVVGYEQGIKGYVSIAFLFLRLFLLRRYLGIGNDDKKICRKCSRKVPGDSGIRNTVTSIESSFGVIQ